MPVASKPKWCAKGCTGRDYHAAFLGDRSISEVSYFGGIGESSLIINRISLIHATMQEGLPNTAVELIPVDNYGQGS